MAKRTDLLIVYHVSVVRLVNDRSMIGYYRMS